MAEVQNLLSSSVHKHNSKETNRITIGVACPKHGYTRGSHCPKCVENANAGIAIQTYDWCKGYWEHIGPEPIYIESKEHLFRECEKRGVMPRAFLKPKSRGAGFEIAKGR